MFKFYKILFLNTLMFSTLLTISSYSWFSMWIGLEINLLSFIPLMTNSKNKYPTEASLKYFFTQALASNILLFAIIMMLNLNTQFLFNNMNLNFELILNSSLLMKLGAAPFHFWFPEIISGLNWTLSLILLTWQKIAPMILIMYSIKFFNFFSIIIIFSSIIGAIQNFNQTDLRKILAYSSINHISWLLMSMFNSLKIWMIYFTFYLIVTINIIFMFKMLNIYKINQLYICMNQSKLIKLLFLSNFFSLSGLPPFFGFMPKWLTLNNLMNNNFFMLSLLMVILVLINMFIYMRIMFSTLTLYSGESIIFNKNLLSFTLMTLNFLFMILLMSITFIILF